MSKQKLRVAILFGGKSSEHNISLLSAKNVIGAIDRKKFEPILIAIDKSGVWHYNEGAMQIVNEEDPKKISLNSLHHPVFLSQNADEHCIVSAEDNSKIHKIDVIFPVLHGIYGEDGSIQGLAKLANLPCVGCGILGSAIGIDKDVTKRLLRDGGIGIADFFTLRKGYNDHISYDTISSTLGSELFIKPANLGSSVGVSFVKNKEEYDVAIKEAFAYDTKVIVEEKLVGREIECAVLGNKNPKASALGEVIPKSEWYSFESKYVDADGAKCEIPANIDAETTEKIQALAINAYRILECEGLTRVDVFLLDNGEIVVNEVNTLPGFTKVSMYPKLWQEKGLSYADLITQLIDFALASHKERNSLKQ